MVLFAITIFVPSLAGSIKVARILWSTSDISDWKKILLIILMIVFSPLLYLILNLIYIYHDIKLEYYPDDKRLIYKKEAFKRIKYEYIKTELGLETMYQLGGQLILLALAYTETPVHPGFKTVFKKGPKGITGGTPGIHIGPILLGFHGLEEYGFTLVFIVFSIIWSFKSFLKSHFKVLSISREHFPITSILVSLAYSFFGCTTRLLAFVMFFTPPLGLFSLLRHLQGEQIPFNAGLIANFVGQNGTGMVSFGNSPSFEWNQLCRWTKADPNKIPPFIYRSYSEHSYIDDQKKGFAEWNPGFLISPPDYPVYTGLRLRAWFVIFLALTLFQVVAHLVSKWYLSRAFHELNWYDKLLHCFENVNLAYNTKEWDDDKGDAQAHRDRKEANWKEGWVGILINAIFNILLLIPMLVLGTHTL